MTYRGSGLARLRTTKQGLAGEASLFFTSPFLVIKPLVRYIGPFELDGKRQDGVIRLSITHSEASRRPGGLQGIDLDMQVQGPDARFSSLAEAEA